MALDTKALTTSFFNVLASDSTGASVRALASVIHADTLDSPPADPFVALRGGPISGARFDVRRLSFGWWVYDSEGRGYRRINDILALIEVAYDPFILTNCEVVQGDISQEIIDSALGNRLARSIAYTVLTRR